VEVDKENKYDYCIRILKTSELTWNFCRMKTEEYSGRGISIQVFNAASIENKPQSNYTISYTYIACL
jgi:spore maturation protein CgeB